MKARARLRRRSRPWLPTGGAGVGAAMAPENARYGTLSTSPGPSIPLNRSLWRLANYVTT